MNYEEINNKVKQFRLYQQLHDYDKAEEIRTELRKERIMLTNEIYGTGWKKI